MEVRLGFNARSSPELSFSAPRHQRRSPMTRERGKGKESRMTVDRVIILLLQLLAGKLANTRIDNVSFTMLFLYR